MAIDEDSIFEIMKWIEAKVVFDHPDIDLATDLIADIFYEFGLQGVVVDDPGVEPEEDWAEDAIARPARHAVIGYFHKDGRAEKRCQILQDKLKRLQQSLELVYTLSYKELDEEDWAQSWKAFFWPRKISRHVVVKPTWRDYVAASDDIVIELDPGMAFGTGTHPTTALCVTLIEKYLRQGDFFLDVGTGSGILMVAAAKLGAERLCGVDKDTMAIDIAANNLKLNGVSTQKIQLCCGHLVDCIQAKYTFVSANIFTQVVLELLESISNVLENKGIFVCSGIIERNQNLVTAKMQNAGFNILEVGVRDEWVAIAGRWLAERSKQGLQP
jgi:ribosomal protein L11 methyltransferase